MRTMKGVSVDARAEHRALPDPFPEGACKRSRGCLLRCCCFFKRKKKKSGRQKWLAVVQCTPEREAVNLLHATSHSNSRDSVLNNPNPPTVRNLSLVNDWVKWAESVRSPRLPAICLRANGRMDRWRASVCMCEWVRVNVLAGGPNAGRCIHLWTDRFCIIFSFVSFILCAFLSVVLTGRWFAYWRQHRRDGTAVLYSLELEAGPNHSVP